MILIILNEWRMLLRQRVLVYLTVFFLVGLTAVAWLGVIQNNKQQAEQDAAKKHVREQWGNLGTKNPHGAAHYGTYAFKPTTPLSSIDEGVNAITGNVLRLEGHAQNDMVYSEASQSLSSSKFGKLKPSLLLQFVIPLFLIFIAFASFSNEKETGRIKLLVVQGASIRKLIFAKALSVWLYSLMLLVFTVALQTLLNPGSNREDSLMRTLGLLFSYGAYYYVASLAVTYLSARMKSNTAALSTMLAVWIVWTVFLPKIWGNTAEKLFPLPNRQEFKTAMADDRSKGIDGHNPHDEREKKLKEKVLAEYKVDDVEQLPINFDGIVMQEDEEYGNQVWDKHYGNFYNILQKQKKIFQFSGIVNPFASLQRVSMGFSGSDMLAHLDFLKQAEFYRRKLIKSLNDKQAFGGSKTGDWSWEVEAEFYKSIEDFNYQAPHIASIMHFYLPDILSLLGWAILVTLIVILTSKNIKLA